MDRSALGRKAKLLMAFLAQRVELFRIEKAVIAQGVDELLNVFTPNQLPTTGTSQERLDVQFRVSSIEKRQRRNPTGRNEENGVGVTKGIAENQPRRGGYGRPNDVDAGTESWNVFIHREDVTAGRGKRSMVN